MESYSNLDSIRELSHSQLEALLRYDSPPETPILPSSNLNASKIDGAGKTCDDTLIYHNREPFDSQVDSQIDFSIFQRHSPAVADNWSLASVNLSNATTDDCINVNDSLKTIEIPDISQQEIDNSYFYDDIFPANTFNYKRATTVPGGHDNNAGYITGSKAKAKQRDYDFAEVDNIFKAIDFNKNMEIYHLNDLESTNCVLRKCQTQFGPKTVDQDVQAKMIATCPTNPGNSSRLLNITAPKKAANDLNPPAKLCSPLSNNNAIVMDDLFETHQSILSFDCSNSSRGQPQNHKYSWHLFDNDSVKDKEIPAGSLANANQLAVSASSIPQSVKQLYDIVKSNYSDFAFIYALSAQLCQDRVPMECFVTLKIALLLSLVSIGNNENRPPIPIVAITNDTYMTDYLMTNIGQMGSRFLGPVDETKTFSTADWLEADAITLARGGVFYAGDWTRLKLRRAEVIFQNIECSSVAIEKSSISSALETAIWTHWRSFKYGAKDQQTFNKFLKIFGIPIFVSDDNHETLIDYILDQASVRVFESTVDHLSINQEDMRNFLICVSQNNVDLSPEAAILLKDYFVASRTLRPDCLSKQSYAVLKQFAESFAKLSLRKIVIAEDALAAIIMCEHFIENVFSPGDYCAPHFGKFEFVGAVDEYLSEFKLWLDAYIKKSQTKA